jgi:acetoacetyl-CoA synthetase
LKVIVKKEKFCAGILLANFLNQHYSLLFLYPGVVRIGTAEIYRQLKVLDEVEDSLVVGRPVKNDIEIVLFVVLSKGVVLDDELRLKIAAQIRDKTTPRHVPRRNFELNDIPRTLNGKKV